MSTLLQDFRYGLRMLRRSPGVTFVAWLSLALGISTVTAIFGFVNGLLLEPLPYLESDRLVLLWEGDLAGAEQGMGSSSEATFEDWRRETRTFELLAALRPVSFSLTDRDASETLFARQVTASYLPLYGIEPILGRTFSEGEEQRGDKVVILSLALWQRQFGGASDVVGRTVELDNETYEIIGVLPEFFSPLEPAPVQLWVPMKLDSANLERRQRRLAVWGRLARDVSLAEAREEMAGLAEELRHRYPEVMGGRGAQVRLAKEILVGGLRPVLLMLFAAGGFVLLMVCGNVIHLLLIRTLARSREMAVRAALGAGESRLLRQLLTENLTLSLAGGGAGLLLAHAGLIWVKARIPVRFGLPRFDGVVIEGHVLLFTLGATLLTVLVFSLMPARLAFSHTQLGDSLKAGGARSTGGRRGHLLRSGLVVTEVALVLVLLVGTGLLVQTFLHLSRLEAGRDSAHVLTLRTSLRGSAYDQAPPRAEFFRRAQEALAALPGVESVGATDLFILGIPRAGVRFTLEGALATGEGSEPTALLQVVTPTYFHTLGIPLVQGRLFEDHDTAQTPAVAMVNRLFVTTYLKDVEPLEQRIVMVDRGGEVREVVGVVDNVRTFNNPPDPVPAIYVPHAQSPAGTMTFVVRTQSDPESLVRSAPAAIGDLDRLAATYGVKTLEMSQAEADWQSRFSMTLLSLFAALAVVLAVTGIYAVMSFSVAERTREFGIRLTFGARPGHVMAIVLGSGLRWAALGLGLGLLATLVLSRWVESQLYGVGAADPWTYVGASVLLTVIVAAASCIPALRALRVDPVACLRQE